MGIPKYHQWLTQKYPDAFAEAQREQADHVYVDVNTLLHDSMRHAPNEDQFISMLFSKFDGLFRTVVPLKSIFLAVDGPASCAKCLTQRIRRRVHATKDQKTSGKGSKGKGKGKKPSGLSNNLLTPGVPFIVRLTSAIEYYVASRMVPGGVLGKCLSGTVSGASAIGEGEHKIVSQMLRHAGSSEAAGKTESHVIFSGDADIFLLALVQSACCKVRVVSERQQQKGTGKRPRAALEIWSAAVLAKYINTELAASPKAVRTPATEAAVRRDFALISLLAGNDYLPELKCSIKPQQLWEQYVQLRRKRYPTQPLVAAQLTDDGLPLSHLEGGWGQGVGESGAAFAAEPYEHYSFHIPLLLDLMKAASGGGGGGGGGSCNEKMAQSVRKYLEGLLWIMEMYHHGYCGDWYFVMEKKHHHAASSSLIVSFLPLLSQADAEPLTPPRSECPPMRPLTCALCILPVTSSEEFLLKTAPPLKPMFSTSHELLGPVNSIEKSEVLKEAKQNVAAFQQQMMSLRNQGLDDSEAKANLNHWSQQMQNAKSGGTDIDVVPLWEVDAEVVERCTPLGLSELDFAQDSTIVRQAGSPPLSLPPPAKMQAIRGAGLVKVDGEWPQAREEFTVKTRVAGAEPEEEDDYLEVEAEDEVDGEGAACAEELEEVCVEEGTGVTFDEGDAVEVYWPDDDIYLPAHIISVEGGSASISWDEDESVSEVPVDYVRLVGAEEPDEAEPPPAKRARR